MTISWRACRLPNMTKYVGILTAGGDSPGLNAAIRGIGKAAQGDYGMHVIGFRDGFRGLMENRTMELDGNTLSDILTIGGTILGYLQRGGTPSAADRLLATRLGSACAALIDQGVYGV